VLFFFLTDKETRLETLSNLLKIPKLTRGRFRILTKASNSHCQVLSILRHYCKENTKIREELTAAELNPLSLLLINNLFGNHNALLHNINRDMCHVHFLICQMRKIILFPFYKNYID
jgi:hypothetical protein